MVSKSDWTDTTVPEEIGKDNPSSFPVPDAFASPCQLEGKRGEHTVIGGCLRWLPSPGAKIAWGGRRRQGRAITQSRGRSSEWEGVSCETKGAPNLRFGAPL